jgi:hypothetical protein
MHPLNNCLLHWRHSATRTNSADNLETLMTLSLYPMMLFGNTGVWLNEWHFQLIRGWCLLKQCLVRCASTALLSFSSKTSSYSKNSTDTCILRVCSAVRVHAYGYACTIHLVSSQHPAICKDRHGTFICNDVDWSHMYLVKYTSTVKSRVLTTSSCSKLVA